MKRGKNNFLRSCFVLNQIYSILRHGVCVVTLILNLAPCEWHMKRLVVSSVLSVDTVKTHVTIMLDYVHDCRLRF
jgi:hypothetical protein